MPHEPKLSVYVITLTPASPNIPWNTNRWLFRNLIGQANTTPLQDSHIMTEVFRRLINDLDTPAMYSDSFSKKCMTVNQSNDSSRVNQNIVVHSDRNIIEGKVEGGTYGRKRNKTSILDKTNTSVVNEGDAITEDFYFLCYCPLASNKCILMLQSYTDDTIDTVMKKFWKNFLSFPSAFNQPTMTKYVPQSIIDDFKRNSKVSSFTYSTEVPGTILLEAPTSTNQRTYKVSVKITPDDDLSVAEFESTAESLSNTLFTRILTLGQFRKKKGTLKDDSTSKTSPFDIGSSFEIEPVIFLSKYITINGDSSDFERIKTYCFGLLETIRPEIYPQDAVRER